MDGSQDPDGGFDGYALGHVDTNGSKIFKPDIYLFLPSRLFFLGYGTTRTLNTTMSSDSGSKRTAYIVIIVVAILLIAAVIGVSIWNNKRNKSAKQAQADPPVPDDGTNAESLYTRLGGIYPIAAIVDDFSNALIVNPTVGQGSRNPQLAEWSRNSLVRLPGLKWMRTLWVCDVGGGPYKFVATKPGACPLSLEVSHLDLDISPEEFDAVAQELKNSMDKFDVPLSEQNQVLTAFSAHKAEVIKGYYASKNETPQGNFQACPAAKMQPAPDQVHH